ncbi:hypothetical protein FBY51_0241 [Zymomonas mobilis]|nr:hypothetical protein ZZ6_0580 [Zymomonas mobilis subsp. mobilis ATCC 29191]TQK78091.1 hypothetical protein FBY53_0747 [Zymomonas mobilis]TQL15263.1 hypothetical protein FBY51_0241 [Zymomonas mobilis]
MENKKEVNYAENLRLEADRTLKNQLVEHMKLLARSFY